MVKTFEAALEFINAHLQQWDQVYVVLYTVDREIFSVKNILSVAYNENFSASK